MAAHKAAGPVVAADEEMSYQEFLSRYDGIHAEWVQGKVQLMAPIGDRHDELSQFMNHLFSTFVALHGLGRVKMAPSQTRLGPDLPGREPDLMYIAPQRLEFIKPNYVDGPPDLVIEIVSPESRVRDYGEKMDEYEQAGVREYWIIDPPREDALFYQLGDDGIFRRITPDAAGRYLCRVLPGLVLEPVWLWRDPLPTILEVADLVRVMEAPGE
ncbi:MAG: Uma2 family endonuclease [Anaerolineae bacterium]|nr:Uma2 family endonuclease [Anaerolineae bacterium]